MTANRTELIKCPFCHEGDFDLVGLKIHIKAGFCDTCEDINILAIGGDKVNRRTEGK